MYICNLTHVHYDTLSQFSVQIPYYLDIYVLVHSVIYCIGYPVVNKEWPSRDDSRYKRSTPSRSRDHLVYKRQGDTPDPPSADCCVNGTKGEKGTQG